MVYFEAIKDLGSKILDFYFRPKEDEKTGRLYEMHCRFLPIDLLELEARMSNGRISPKLYDHMSSHAVSVRDCIDYINRNAQQLLNGNTIEDLRDLVFGTKLLELAHLAMNGALAYVATRTLINGYPILTPFFIYAAYINTFPIIANRFNRFRTERIIKRIENKLKRTTLEAQL